MSTDELQSLWQQLPGDRERQGALMYLVHERGSAFKKQVRSQNLLGYVVGLLSPLMLLGFWIIDDPWTRWGGSLFCLSAIAIAFEVWWFYRRGHALPDASLRDHAGALLRAYDRRMAFWRWMYCSVVPLQIAGAAALVMSLPNSLRWILGAVAALGLIAAFVIEERRFSELRRKREEVSKVLQVLDAPTP